jgi:hypothetical protein
MSPPTYQSEETFQSHARARARITCTLRKHIIIKSFRLHVVVAFRERSSYGSVPRTMGGTHDKTMRVQNIRTRRKAKHGRSPPRDISSSSSETNRTAPRRTETHDASEASELRPSTAGGARNEKFRSKRKRRFVNNGLINERFPRGPMLSNVPATRSVFAIPAAADITSLTHRIV